MLRHIFPIRSTIAMIALSVLAAGCASNLSQPESAGNEQHVVADQTAETDPAVTLQEWFVEARNAVDKALKTDLSEVELHVTDTQGISIHAKTSLLHALKHDLDNRWFAESLVDNILTLQTESVLAIYAPSVKQILLHDKNLKKYFTSLKTGKKQAMQALLVHELVHAADDQKHDAFKHHSMSYQEVFAKSAVVEGHAQWQTRKICKSLACSGAFENLNAYMFNSGSPDDPALQYVQDRSFKNLEFVYKEGERFIDKLKKRENPEAALALAFSNPPRDSIQIIDPDSFPNREREERNERLSDVIENAAKPWNKNSTGSLKRNILAAAAFSVDPSARQPIVNFYTSKILAATKHEYYEHASDTPIPVAVIALQTDSNNTARKTASLIFESTLNTYNQLKGDIVEIEEWRKQHHTAEASTGQPNSNPIDMHTASGYIKNGLVDAEYPVEVITATSGNYLVHIDGRYAHGHNDLMQFAGRLLSSMQNINAK